MGLVDVIQRDGKVFAIDGEDTLPGAAFFDEFGNETEDWSTAHAAAFGPDRDGLFLQLSFVSRHQRLS